MSSSLPSKPDEAENDAFEDFRPRVYPVPAESADDDAVDVEIATDEDFRRRVRLGQRFLTRL